MVILCTLLMASVKLACEPCADWCCPLRKNWRRSCAAGTADPVAVLPLLLAENWLEYGQGLNLSGAGTDAREAAAAANGPGPSSGL